MWFNIENIPYQLLNSSNYDGDINILIGENGSGKSTLLNELSKQHLANRNSVIAIANTIYDKFDSRDSNFKILRASTGKSLVRNTIVNAFKILANDDLKRLRNIAKTLEYIGFDPIIGVKLKGINKEFRGLIIESDLLGEEKENLLYFLNRYADKDFDRENIVKINFYNESFYDIRNSYLIQIFLYEKQLKKLKLLRAIDIYLYKNENHMPLNKASSGELTVVSSLIYITSTINEKSVILIDEPENSLHPKWQIEYVKKLDELFYLYQPKVIIATHSPLIINGAEINIKHLNIFKGNNGKFIFHESKITNVEEIYEDFFDITTPKNRYVSEYIIEKMNLLTSNKISIEQFELFVNELKENSYDEDQKEALRGIIQMGREVIKEIQ